MSLKLGNTNIAGTQVLYSTTGNNIDGAMTQNATTTQLNLKANDTDVIHKTGDETITGNKTFSGTTTVVTPAVSDNSTKPVTTAYIENKFQVVSTLPANPDSNVYYFIPE